VENAHRCTGWEGSRDASPPSSRTGVSRDTCGRDWRSRMRREFHVRFCEGPRVRFPRATRLVMTFERRDDAERVMDVDAPRRARPVHDPDSRRTTQLETPVENSRGDLDEVVTVQDPTHPLYGRSFRVASRPAARPGKTASAYVTVFYERGDVLLRIPPDALELSKIGQATQTKITAAAAQELVSTARPYAPCPSIPAASGAPSPMSCKRRSRQT